MLDYENSFNPFPERRISIENWKKYSQIDILESNELLNFAIELFESGIKAKDSLHIASAVKEVDYSVNPVGILYWFSRYNISSLRDYLVFYFLLPIFYPYGIILKTKEYSVQATKNNFYFSPQAAGNYTLSD